MPYLGLVITSVGFLFPSIIAYKNKKKWLGRAMRALTLTSILFHGTEKKICKQIDIAYVYALAITYISKNLFYLIKKHRKQDIYINTGTFLSLYYYFLKCNNNKYPILLQKKHHMVFHIMSQYLFSYYAAL
jgi:hypothetical protein